MKRIILIIIILFLLSSNIAYGISIKEQNIDKINDDSSDLPSYFSWRDIDGVDYTTPIRLQQPYHSCETFAFVAALETMVQWEVGYPFGCDLSEAHLFFCSNGNLDWGSYPENDTNYLVEHGIPDEACFPYPKDKKQYYPKDSCPCWQKRSVKIKNWSYLPANNITAIKKALINNGPVPTHLNVYFDYRYYLGGYVYRHIWGESLALHLVCIVGYKDDPKIPSGGYWIVKNSWGSEWGEDGWFRIAYGEASIEEMPVYFEGVYGNFPIIFVDDDNIIGPWDGSKEHPYKNISTAIDNAYEGWTIYVKNGIYNENLIIDKKINIDGENRENTIIDGNQNGIVIYVQKPNVRISGLTIQNSGKNRLDSGIRTLHLDSSLTVTNCIIKDNDVGIYLNCVHNEKYLDSKNIIKNNIIKNNNIGIFTTWVNNNEISNNIIENNTIYGIETEASEKSRIEKNIIKNNGQIGIYLHGASDENEIINNDFLENNFGIKLRETKKTKINNNNFIDNNIHATFEKSYLNNWNNNYWDDHLNILPHMIKGKMTNFNLPWYNFDFVTKINPI